MKYLYAILFVVLLSFSCKTVKEEWLTPQWILDKIDLLESDCKYAGSSIKSYKLDTTIYVYVYIPGVLWRENEVYYEDGTQAIVRDTAFSFYYFNKNKGTAVETYWTFPDSKGCSEIKD